jgi:ketosteroid isomerase-like protein
MKTSRFLGNACAAGVAVWLSMAAVWAQPPGAAQADSSLAARVRRLEDIEEIRTLLLDYGRYLDSRNLVAYSRLFARDGEWVGGFGTAKGPEGIQAFMEKNLGTGPNRGNTYHILSNFIINVNGDTATAWSRWTFITSGADGKPVISQGGRYDDALTREDGRWKFKRRLASNDIPAPKF